MEISHNGVNKMEGVEDLNRAEKMVSAHPDCRRDYPEPSQVVVF